MITAMLCVYCCMTRRDPEDFPDRWRARCRDCWPKTAAPRPSLWARVRAWLATP